MKDGLYQVVTNLFCAGFVVEDGKVTQCAPILKNKLEYWKIKAVLIEGNKQMQITILSVSVEHVPGKNGGYDKAEVAYKDADGKVAGKNLVSFNAPEAFAVVKASGNGDVLDVTTEKDAKGYWQWTKVVKLDAAQVAAAPKAADAPVGKAGANPTPKNTYETPEERAFKQLCIVRQTGIERALNTLQVLTGDKFTVEDVIAVARQYEAYVFEEKKVVSNTLDFKDDADQVL